MGLKYNEITGEFEEEKNLGLGDLVFDPVSGEFRYKSSAVAASGKRSARKSTSNPRPDFKLSEDGKTLIKAKKRIGSTVVIPDGVEVIKKEAFYENKYITEVFIPEGVKVIESMAFYRCTKLTNVHLPKSLEEIGSFCFAYCNELKELFLDENVREVGFRPFSGNAVVASSNKYLKSVDGAILSKGGRILYYVPHDKEEYDVPNGVEILTHSFYSNKIIKKVTLPKTLKIVGDSAFSGFALKDVVLPEGVEEISSFAFSGCKELKELFLDENVKEVGFCLFGRNVVVDLKNKYLKSVDGAIVSKDGRILYYVPHDKTEYDVPDGVEILKDSFSINNTIKKVTLPKTLKIIGYFAFCCCYALKDVVLPEGLEEIGDNAFEFCYSLEELIIPDSVQRIGICIFNHSNLKKIVFKAEYPENIIWYKSGLLSDWGNLKDETVFYVPQNALERYQQIERFKNVTLVSIADNSNANPLSDFQLSEDGKTLIKAKETIGATVVIPDGVEVIKEKAFYENKYITEVFIPEGVKVIEFSAFNDCSNLINVHLPNSLEEIGSGIFSGCHSLKTIELPNGLKEIGFSVFSFCYSLEELTIPESIHKIGSDIFTYSNIKKINFKTEYPERVEWDDLRNSTPTYWGNLANKTVFYVPQNALEKYRKLDQFKNVTIAPILGNSKISANSMNIFVSKEHAQYKSKADFCHIGDIVVGETTWAEANKKGYTIERFKGGDKRFFHCEVGYFWDDHAIGRFNHFYWGRSIKFPAELERLGLRGDLSYDAFMTLFKSWGFWIKVIIEPQVELFMGRKTLKAAFKAVSFDKSIRFRLNFKCRNENDEGVTTRSSNTLDSFSFEVY